MSFSIRDATESQWDMARNNWEKFLWDSYYGHDTYDEEACYEDDDPDEDGEE